MAVTDPPVESTARFNYPSLPGLGVADAVRRHWPLVTAPVVVLLIAAVILGSTYKPTYTAQARLNVGRLDVSTQSIPGYAVGIQSLAVAYSRALTADAVVRPVAKKLHLRPRQVAGRLNGSPVPQAPLIIVSATGHSQKGAVDLANEASDQLVTYLSNVNVANPDADRLLGEYKTAVARLTDLQNVRSRAKRTYDGSATTTNRKKLSKATADEQEQSLQTQALKSSYLSSQQGASQATLVQLLNPAKGASSNKRSRIEALLFGALVVGLLIGIALAVSRSRTLLRRALLRR